MDILEAKSRVAEALVESIFRRARYGVRPFSPDAVAARFPRKDLSPDFVAATAANGHPAAEVLVEVKYRPSIEQFLSVENQRGERSLFEMTRRQWPDLYFVLVSDRPESGRSCFQAVAMQGIGPGGPFRSTDLDQLSELNIFRSNLEDHEVLARRIFGLLATA